LFEAVGNGKYPLGQHSNREHHHTEIFRKTHVLTSMKLDAVKCLRPINFLCSLTFIVSLSPLSLITYAQATDPGKPRARQDYSRQGFPGQSSLNQMYPGDRLPS
jgi:hypothetical protein